jgi:hypothetical protein
MAIGSSLCWHTLKCVFRDKRLVVQFTDLLSGASFTPANPDYKTEGRLCCTMAAIGISRRDLSFHHQKDSPRMNLHQEQRAP